MTVAMTPAVCRLLFVCFFCTLWGGAVWAEVPGSPTKSLEEAAAKVKEAQETLQKVLDNLKEAAVLADKQKQLEGEQGDSFDFSKPQSNAKSLLAAVDNAKKLSADAVQRMAGGVFLSFSDEELKEVLNTAFGKTNNLSNKVNEVHAKAEEINVAADPTTAEGSLETLTESIIQQLKEVEKMAEDTLKAHVEAAEKIAKAIAEKATASTLGNTREVSQDEERRSGTAPGNTLQGTTNNETGKSENKHSDKPNLQDTHNTQEQKNNEPPKPLSSTHTGHERDTPPPALQNGYEADGAHGGAIATCTAAPLLLLLTAVAYAAVF